AAALQRKIDPLGLARRDRRPCHPPRIGGGGGLLAQMPRDLDFGARRIGGAALRRRLLRVGTAGAHRAVQPPSTDSEVPVIEAAVSPHRNTVSAPSSSIPTN